MDSSLLIAAAASFVAGVMGYIIARMWIKPIVGYQITKHKLDGELTRYLAGLHQGGVTRQDGESTHGEGVLHSARTHAMQLSTHYSQEIPYWYRLLLDSRKESPTEAAGLLTNLSRIRDPEQHEARIIAVRKHLNLR